MRAIWTISVFILATLAAFTGTALAATAASPGDGAIDLARPVFEAVMSGNYAAAAALALVLVVALIRRYGGSRFPFLQTDAGGAVLALFGSFGGAVATAALAGASVFTGPVMWTALTIAVAAAGGYSLIKKLLVVPFLRPLAARAPAWMRPIFDLVFWVFERPDPVVAAEKAGADAVTAKPSTGVSGVIGAPTDLE